MMNGPESLHRPVLTFRPRRGRVTPRQQRGLDELWPRFGVDVRPETLDPVALFGRRAPLVLEIGFGMGETTAILAEAEPDRDVLAADVHTPGVGALLSLLGERGLTNVRVVAGDAMEVLRDMLRPGSLDEVRVFFPDPWPKQRHVNRRLVSPEFVRLVADRLAPGGRLHVATDWPPYAGQVLAVIAAEPASAKPPLTARPAPRVAPGHPLRGPRPLQRAQRCGRDRRASLSLPIAPRPTRDRGISRSRDGPHPAPGTCRPPDGRGYTG